ncbi:EAL domain-containing protein [Azospirillum sp. TSO22-1]|uniref:bifunctional diguanylate cyclase/phosphodiesterase n=1 Tax=Azospirillum sp. TSO22-1 TaxID=716789 RepID=UPI001304B9F3|nr:EAL domain-containing protein [Azospirillum sp. TSO22-1]
MAKPDEAPPRQRRIFSDLSSDAHADIAVDRLKNGGRRLAFATLAVALAATLALSFWTYTVVEREASERFSARVGEMHSRIGERMLAYAQVLRSAAGLFKVTPVVSRQAWDSFVRSLDLERQYPGIPAVALARLMNEEELTPAAEAAWADGINEFTIRPQGKRDAYMVNVYSAPPTPLNRAALGYDMLSEPVRRAVILTAAATGEPAITPRLTLKIDEHRAPQPAFIMYYPVYRPGAPTQTEQERRDALYGMVLAPLRTYPLIEGVLSHNVHDVALSMYDGPSAVDEQEMYRSPAFPEAPRLTETRPIAFYGRTLTVAYRSTPQFERSIDSDKPLMVLAAGGMISLLLFGVVLSLSSTRARAMQLASEMTMSLRRREAELHHFFTQAPVGILILDADGRVIDCNPMIGRFMGVPADEVIGFNMITDARDQSLAPAIRRAATGDPVEIETQYISTLGNRVGFYHVHFQPVYRNDALMFVLAFVDDVTERKAAEQRVHYLAHYDALTGLPNRTLLQDRLAHAITAAKRSNGTVAVLFLDLDHFKVINDSLGHTIGDEVLKDVAVRLQQALREVDTVGRLGGDEFIIVLPDAGSAADVARVAARILDCVCEPMRIKDRDFTISPSVGISLFPADGEDGERLIKNADAAMYQAKAAGRHAFRFFTTSMDAQLNERLNLEANIRRALDLGEFRLHYQPQIELGSGRVTGLEALIRWAHPDLGMVPPGRFIPVAEESGQISAISLWVLDEACRQAKLWQAEGLPLQRVAVNISALQFRSADLPGQVSAALTRHGLPPWCLELEVTEGALIRNVDMAILILKSLKEMGVKVSIDDFGTGYSSLSYLQRFPVDTLKIDRSFVNDVPNDQNDAAIVKAIIGLGSSLGLQVIAEGVETEQQLNFLRESGCHGGQGYLFSPPIPPDDASRFLLRKVERTALVH